MDKKCEIGSYKRWVDERLDMVITRWMDSRILQVMSTVMSLKNGTTKNTWIFLVLVSYRCSLYAILPLIVLINQKRRAFKLPKTEEVAVLIYCGRRNDDLLRFIWWIPTEISQVKSHAPVVIPKNHTNKAPTYMIFSMGNGITRKIHSVKSDQGRKYSRRRTHLNICSDTNCQIICHTCYQQESRMMQVSFLEWIVSKYTITITIRIFVWTYSE